MDIDRGSFEQQMLEHAGRQTKALEAISTYFQRLLAVLVVIALVAVIAWLVHH